MRRRTIWIGVGLAMLIISQDPDRPKPGWTAESIAGQPVWNRLQESLKRLSSRSGRIIARNSGHHVMIDRPTSSCTAFNNWSRTCARRRTASAVRPSCSDNSVA
jgi:hypothetical protein